MDKPAGFPLIDDQPPADCRNLFRSRRNKSPAFPDLDHFPIRKLNALSSRDSDLVDVAALLILRFYRKRILSRSPIREVIRARRNFCKLAITW